LNMRALLVVLSLCLVCIPRAASSQGLTQDEALALVFSGADLERRTAFLDEADLALADRLAGPDVDVEAGVVSYYVASRGGVPIGVAYFDAHRVRTLPQVLMIVVDTEGRVSRVETVSFREPPEYRAPDGWLRQFDDRALDDALSLRGEIATITGATLTAGAATRAARRVLALHQVIDPLSGGTQ
jgi:hypothetical protein